MVSALAIGDKPDDSPVVSRQMLIVERLENLADYWCTTRSVLNWNCVFVIPPWLEVWWHEFGSMADSHLCVAKRNGHFIGVSPLLVRGEEVSFIGSSDLCDYFDFVVAPGSERDFFNMLLDYARVKDMRGLNLGPVRSDSTVFTYFVGMARERGGKVSCVAMDVTVELDLPGTWEGYLALLDGKQRHEVRRKLRKLRSAGRVHSRFIEKSEAVVDAMDVFLRLFRKSNQDKAMFMTAKRESFFRSLMRAMAQVGLLRLSILELDGDPVAATICFDYENTVYLYNSGYDPDYGSLSVGLVSKILCIKDSIDRGRVKFDFLKGAEEYKYRLGGNEIPLYGCEVVLK